MWSPIKHFGPIGSAVLTFIGYKQTNKQTDTQTSKVYIWYIYFACLSICVQLTSKRLNRLGLNFLWDLTWPQGMFMDAQNFKKLSPNFFDFCKILKCAKKYYEIGKLFIYVLYCTKRRCSQIMPQLKVEIEDGREAP